MSLSKTLYPPRKTRPGKTEKILTGKKNQFKQTNMCSGETEFCVCMDRRFHDFEADFPLTFHRKSASKF